MASKGQVILCCENLSFAYESNSKKVLHDLNLQVVQGEFLVLLGQSGCGKSTLLRLLAGLDLPTAGQIKIAGIVNPAPGLDRAVVFQEGGLFPWMSVGGNLKLALRGRRPRLSRSEAYSLVIQALAAVGLSPDVARRYPRQLSGGMKSRCALAQSLLLGAPVLLMDEPFGALDAITRARLQRLLLRLHQQAPSGKRPTVVFVTHDVDEALLMGTRLILLGQGGRLLLDVPVPQGNDDESTRDKRALRGQVVSALEADVDCHLSDDV